MTPPNTKHHRLRVAHLNPNAPSPFELRPNDTERKAIAVDLNLSGLLNLEMRGEIRAEGADDWVLTARLTAKAVQQCVLTLKPVKTAVDSEVRRHYTPNLPETDADEVEMLDETLEPLGQFIDLTAVMIEELALALPEYPRAENANLPEASEYTPDPETRRPFADLDKLLKDRRQ